MGDSTKKKRGRPRKIKKMESREAAVQSSPPADPLSSLPLKDKEDGIEPTSENTSLPSSLPSEVSEPTSESPPSDAHPEGAEGAANKSFQVGFHP